MVRGDHHTVPAIVLGRGPTALGILRCLQLAGIPAYVACPASDLATRSRWFRPTPGPTPWDGAIGPHAYDVLRNMPLAEAVLIAGADDAALWLADLPHSELGNRFKVSSSSRLSQEILQDKSCFAAFLKSTDIPHPPTFRIDSIADIDAIPFDMLNRVFIKPVNSQKFSDVTGVKGVWVKRKEDLYEAWQKLHVQGFMLMAQEYVPGSVTDHYFVDGFRDTSGRLTGLFTRQRIRISPPDFGNSSYCRSIPIANLQAPIDSMTTLLSKLDYRGIFSAEFKRDARDGKFRILEVNTRAWTYVEFAARCGVNVCEMAYQDATGLPVTVASKDYVVDAGCVDLHRDISAVRAQDATSRERLPRILLQWVRAHFHSFRFDDPSPGLSVAWKLVTQRLKRYSGTWPILSAHIHRFIAK
jgi:predicted ATP-grasp superfamily ATP-dependent carboligase